MKRFLDVFYDKKDKLIVPVRVPPKVAALASQLIKAASEGTFSFQEAGEIVSAAIYAEASSKMSYTELKDFKVFFGQFF